MKMPELSTMLKTRVVFKTLIIQVCLLCGILLAAWGLQALYAATDRTTFPQGVSLPTDTAKLTENEKGKILLDAITHQLRREMDSTFGWTFNDIIFNRYISVRTKL